MPLAQRPPLTTRDLSILTFIWSYGGLTPEFIQRRFFNSPGGRSPCYRRLAHLAKAGYLTRLRLPSLSGQGSGKAFFNIGPNSRAVLAKALGLLSHAELGRRRLSAPRYIDHHLAIAEVHLNLEMACAHSSVFHLQEWIPERELERSPVKVTDPKTGKPLVLIPDGAFILALADGREQPFLVEVDRGTVSSKRLRAKLRGYLVSSSESPVLFIAPDIQRQAAIAKWAVEEAESLGLSPTLFWLTTQQEIKSQSMISSGIWQVAGGSFGLALLDLVGPAAALTPIDHDREDHVAADGSF